MATKAKSKKHKRHDGWVTPKSTLRCSRKEIIDNCLEPQPFYDEWVTSRDGQRNTFGDRTKLKKKDVILMAKEWWPEERIIQIISDNKKQRKLIRRRKTMKLNRVVV